MTNDASLSERMVNPKIVVAQAEATSKEITLPNYHCGFKRSTTMRAVSNGFFRTDHAQRTVVVDQLFDKWSVLETPFSTDKHSTIRYISDRSAN